jgi:ElaB/YqjD/DUF883 family membrane-anchored ribosome-binding protein
MSERKRTSAPSAAASTEDDPSRAELQRRMEEARESISQTVDEIKDTVSEQYENVKETVTEALDWKEQLQKNPLVWGIGAVAVGLAVGYSIALVRQGDNLHSRRRPKRSQTDDFTDTVFDGLATLGQSYLLPAVAHKVKELFGVDITEDLLGHRSRTPAKPAARKRSTKKTGAKKSAAKKRATKKSGAK